MKKTGILKIVNLLNFSKLLCNIFYLEPEPKPAAGTGSGQDWTGSPTLRLSKIIDNIICPKSPFTRPVTTILLKAQTESKILLKCPKLNNVSMRIP